jgi:hypothetical protein
MIAAMMTAANLGARITGYGFVVFTVGSICWTIVGLSTGQQNLLVANGFLTIVNAVGTWRWLGRQARFEDGGKVAEQRSERATVPNLFSAASLVGATINDSRGTKIGMVVDAMLHGKSRELTYVVVSEGGVAGVGGVLHAVDPALFSYGADGVVSSLDSDGLKALPVIAVDDWPASLPGEAAGAD